MSLYARIRASDQPSMAFSRSPPLSSLSCLSASSRRRRGTRLYIFCLSELVADFLSVVLRLCSSRS